jgi:predicted GH43/DUF377 family glycosyl hydrolase
LAQLFVPGHAIPGSHGERASGVVAHILQLSDAEVEDALSAIVTSFDARHRDLTQTFLHHADRIGNRLDAGTPLSAARRLLLGATFTQEYAVEAAAVCNPSAVPHPDQAPAPTGALRFVMSIRQIGEGHRSSVGFRTGVIDDRGDVTIDDRGPHCTAGTVEAPVLTADAVRGAFRRRRDDAEATNWVLEGLEDHFTIDELGTRLSELEAQQDTRRNAPDTARRLRAHAARSYTVHFAPETQLAERVLYPATASEANGIEDARFVRWIDDDGSATYYATYNGFDGTAISQQLLATHDFLSFTVTPLIGTATSNKGMSLFPRRVGGRFAALSRHDGAGNAIAISDDIERWNGATPIEAPRAMWETVQVGNCGSPIETSEGWLVLVHGVGPMRTYSIGAWLLDLDDPTRMIGRMRDPLLSPQPDEQDGYVPNVVYSCGALLHGATLFIPYGAGDSTIGLATLSLYELLAAIRGDEDALRA